MFSHAADSLLIIEMISHLALEVFSFCLNGRFVFIDFGFTRLSRNAIFEVTQYTVDNEDTLSKKYYTHTGKRQIFKHLK